MGFGERLRSARESKKLTQDQLGQGLGTDGKDAGKQVVSGWEKNLHFPRVDQLGLICEKLGCTADHLVFGRSAWPFERIAIERYLALDSTGRAYVEGKLSAAIEECESSEPLKDAREQLRRLTLPTVTRPKSGKKAA